jgi:hypothetical protein
LPEDSTRPAPGEQAAVLSLSLCFLGAPGQPRLERDPPRALPLVSLLCNSNADMFDELWRISHTKFSESHIDVHTYGKTFLESSFEY